MQINCELAAHTFSLISAGKRIETANWATPYEHVLAGLKAAQAIPSPTDEERKFIVRLFEMMCVLTCFKPLHENEPKISLDPEKLLAAICTAANELGAASNPHEPKLTALRRVGAVLAYRHTGANTKRIRRSLKSGLRYLEDTIGKAPFPGAMEVLTSGLKYLLALQRDAKEPEEVCNSALKLSKIYSSRGSQNLEGDYFLADAFQAAKIAGNEPLAAKILEQCQQIWANRGFGIEPTLRLFMANQDLGSGILAELNVKSQIYTAATLGLDDAMQVASKACLMLWRLVPDSAAKYFTNAFALTEKSSDKSDIAALLEVLITDLDRLGAKPSEITPLVRARSTIPTPLFVNASLALARALIREDKYDMAKFICTQLLPWLKDSPLLTASATLNVIVHALKNRNFKAANRAAQTLVSQEVSGADASGFIVCLGHAIRCYCYANLNKPLAAKRAAKKFGDNYYAESGDGQKLRGAPRNPTVDGLCQMVQKHLDSKTLHRWHEL